MSSRMSITAHTQQLRQTLQSFNFRSTTRILFLELDDRSNNFKVRFLEGGTDRNEGIVYLLGTQCGIAIQRDAVYHQ